MSFTIRPVCQGDYENFENRGNYQIRINIWGFPAKILWKFMRYFWMKQGITVLKEGQSFLNVRNIYSRIDTHI